MAQQTIFPIRFGLPVPRGEALQAVEVFSEGGLDLTQSVIENRPGCASKLINFEVALSGGYRRIDGFSLYSPNIVPGQGQIIGTFVYYGGQVLAARRDAVDGTKYNLYYSTGDGWTQINPVAQTFTGNTHTNTTVDNLNINTNTLCIGQAITGLVDIPPGTTITNINSPTSITISNAATNTTVGETLNVTNPLNFTVGMVLQSKQYNWTGTSRIVITDGVNPAYRWDGIGTALTIFNSAGSSANPQFSHVFSGYLFVAGYTTNTGAIKYCAPNNDRDWLPVDGAAEIVIGDTITGLASWRGQLIIFCANSIHQLQFVTATTPNVNPVTFKIGCLDGRTIQEIDGDLLYLSTDGMRTISGTFNIGDTEIASISRPIQFIVKNINPQLTPVHSLVVDRKTQYRLYYPTATAPDDSCPGIIGGIRRFRDGHEAWEWGQLTGVKPACCHSGFMNTGEEHVIHGGFDGFIYQHEKADADFNGRVMNEVYQTVPLELGDYGLRKAIHRVTIYTIIELAGTINQLTLRLIYDLNSAKVTQPGPYILTGIGGGTSVYNNTLYNSGAAYNSMGNAAFRQSVQGSGFLVSLLLSEITTSHSYTIQGYYIEYYPAGRR